NGSVLPQVKSAIFSRPTALVVAADGIYSGRQSKARKGTHVADASGAFRIGYRHNGMSGVQMMTNVVFADGHAEGKESGEMPASANAVDNSGAVSFLVGQ